MSTKHERSEAAAALGKMRSAAKTKAARENAKKGGRPPLVSLVPPVPGLDRLARNDQRPPRDFLIDAARAALRTPVILPEARRVRVRYLTSSGRLVDVSGLRHWIVIYLRRRGFTVPD